MERSLASRNLLFEESNQMQLNKFICTKALFLSISSTCVCKICFQKIFWKIATTSRRHKCIIVKKKRSSPGQNRNIQLVVPRSPHRCSRFAPPLQGEFPLRLGTVQWLWWYFCSSATSGLPGTRVRDLGRRRRRREERNLQNERKTSRRRWRPEEDTMAAALMRDWCEVTHTTVDLPQNLPGSHPTATTPSDFLSQFWEESGGIITARRFAKAEPFLAGKGCYFRQGMSLKSF